MSEPRPRGGDAHGRRKADRALACWMRANLDEEGDPSPKTRKLYRRAFGKPLIVVVVSDAESRAAGERLDAAWHR